MNYTLPTDSNDRKNYALFSGCLRYFPAALAGVSKTSKLGNDKHNPGEEMHHARNKSGDHGDCILRHLIDLDDLLAAMKRGEDVSQEIVLSEASSLAWRALALSQELHEKFGSPLAPGAKTESTTSSKDLYKAAEEAQAKVAEMVKSNKEKIFTVAKETAKPKFEIGEAVIHTHNDGPEVTVYGNFYDENLKPIMLVRDSNGKVFQVDPNFYELAPIVAVDENGTTHKYTRNGSSHSNPKGI